MPKNERKNRKKVETIIIGFFIFFVVLRLSITYFSDYYMTTYTDIIQSSIEQRLLTECKAVKNMISPEQLQEFTIAEDMERPIYQELRHELTVYAEENDLKSVYFMRLVGDEIQYIIDSDLNPETQVDLKTFESKEVYPIAMKAFNGEESYSWIGKYEEGWEGVVSGYLPIYDENRNIIATVGVDISDKEIVQARNISRILLFASVTSTVFLVTTSILMITLYRRKARDYNNASIAKGEFLSRMSHEIRTPMNAITGFCQIARKTKDDDKKDEYLDYISNSSDYLLQVINNILDISKIEAGKMNLNVEKVSIHKIMGKIEKIIKLQVELKKQKFSYQISEDIPRYVYCDRMRLKEVIMNLTSNAIKFTHEGGEISIAVSLIEKKESSCNVEFIVKDNGIGIEEEFLPKLFDSFEQVDGGITRKYGGTGLGLAIAKLFVEMMNGKISVTSKLNEGSTFRFNVWVDEVSEGEEPKNNDEIIEETIDCSNMTFLVVEDNEINQVLAQRIFEGFGARIEIANNGAGGVEKFIQNPEKYNIIFMDIQMPGMDGFEAAKQIRESDVKNAKTIPIIAITAGVFEEDIKKALDAGMNAHLGKPFKISDIVQVIKNYV